MGHAERTSSQKVSGGGVCPSKMMGFPSLTKVTARKKPRTQLATRGSVALFLGVMPECSNLELQQSHLQRECFLDIRRKQSLELLELLEVLHGLVVRDALCHFLDGGAQLREGPSFLSRAHSHQPDVAHPPLHPGQNLRALSAIFGFYGGLQLLLPFLAQGRFNILGGFER